MLGDGHQITRDVSLGWTAAQKNDLRNFRTGQVLGFHRAVKGIGKNEMLEVVRADEKRVIVRNQWGEERTITGKQAQCFDVFERHAFQVASGDRLLLTANRRQAGFRATNGEIVKVDRVEQDGRISLDDGRVVPRDYTHLAYGYAITAHRSQGKTVDAVIVSGDGMRKELFYVAASRGRESVTVITSDAETLRETVASSTARQSATELARKGLLRGERGVRRGRDAARELVRYASRRMVAPKRAEVWLQPQVERVHERGVSR